MKQNNIIKGRKGQQLNQREVGLINNGVAEGLLLFDVKEKSYVTLTYNVNGLMSLRDFLKLNEMSKRLFVVLLRNVVVALKSVESNKLNRDLIMWDLNTSYVDPASWHVYLTYVPLQPYETTGTLKAFLQRIVSVCNFAFDENLEYVQQLVEDLNSGVAYSVSKLEDYCNGISEQLVGIDARKLSTPLCPRCSAKLMPQEAICPYCGIKTRAQITNHSSDNSKKNIRVEKSVEINKGNPVDPYHRNGNISVNEDENGVITVFRGTRNMLQTVWIEDLERVGRTVVTKFPFRIGKMEGVTDYRIYNNRVSRKHADVVKEQGKYFIIDLGSTNGTFLNGRRLQPGVKEELYDGFVFVLADSKFKFHID